MVDELIARRDHAADRLAHALGYLNITGERPDMLSLKSMFYCCAPKKAANKPSHRLSRESFSYDSNKGYAPLLDKNENDDAIEQDDAIEYWGLKLHVLNTKLYLHNLEFESGDFGATKNWI